MLDYIPSRPVVNLAVDIETIPSTDEKLISALITRKTQRYRDPKKIQEYTEKYREELALSPLTGSVVCVCAKGIVSADSDFPFDETENALDFSLCTKDESHLLDTFAKFISELKSKYIIKFITYNGKSFDFPYLMVRASKYSIPLRLPIDMYKYDKHIDLLANFFKAGSLNEWGHFYGICSVDRISGADIPMLFINGMYNEIQMKCAEDVRILLDIYNKIKDCLPE